jgi:hypothetical protein
MIWGIGLRYHKNLPRVAVRIGDPGFILYRIAAGGSVFQSGGEASGL